MRRVKQFHPGRAKAQGSLLLAVLAFAALLTACASPAHRQVFVLGIDGLDPQLLQRFMEEGKLPHFSELAGRGEFKPMTTTMPPLSPVAWSTFITGTDPGGHGIFDFIHRDPRTYLPEFSMSKASGSGRNLRVGSWVLPISGGSVEQLRQGRAFWELLDEAGIPTTVFRMPVNFPPQGDARALSGMGTPDILGTSGTFSFFSSSRPGKSDSVPGGRLNWLQLVGNRATGTLRGPNNTFREVDGLRGPENPEMKLDFQVLVDPDEPVVRFVVQDNEFILKEGEWSDWIRLEFEAIPYLAGVTAVARFYLQEVRPEFRLYVTPLQINPEEPVMPISSPGDWSRELVDELGYFYTQELAEETKALSNGVFSAEEFWRQARFVFEEQERAFDLLLRDYREGFMFFYFSGVDQVSHMLWRYADTAHPAYIEDASLAGAIGEMYQKMDGVLGRLMERLDENATLIVMSDHGFAPFSRGVNLNSWLLEAGYVGLRDPSRRGEEILFGNVDWNLTKAYALGLNGVYVNLHGRERSGIVSSGAYEELLEKLESELLAMVDPETGEKPISLVVRTKRDFHGPHLDGAPDLVVGYNRGYRSSWASPLGEFPAEIFEVNLDAWSGDHAMDHRFVPGVLLSNRSITLDQPALYDLTVSVLDEYGVEKLPEMIGSDCLAPSNREK